LNRLNTRIFYEPPTFRKAKLLLALFFFVLQPLGLVFRRARTCPFVQWEYFPQSVSLG
jgi:hypothetical protein